MPLPNHPRAVVTGAGSGLGRALCGQIVARGGSVIAADVNLASAEDTARALGPRAHAVACDVARLPEVEALADAADRLLGGVDLVVNNAGVLVGGEVGAIPIADWQWLVGVNVWGVIHGCHVFVPRLKARGGGHILNVASAAGLVAPARLAPYNVSKAAVVALSETLHAELGGRIGVTVLCPMFFPSGIAQAGRISDSMRREGERLLHASKASADAIAARALAGVDAGELYVVPHESGRWLWRLKRLAPELLAARFNRAMAWYMQRKL